MALAVTSSSLLKKTSDQQCSYENFLIFHFQTKTVQSIYINSSQRNFYPSYSKNGTRNSWCTPFPFAVTMPIANAITCKYWSEQQTFALHCTRMNCTRLLPLMMTQFFSISWAHGCIRNSLRNAIMLILCVYLSGRTIER